jgi:hypothetical protein
MTKPGLFDDAQGAHETAKHLVGQCVPTFEDFWAVWPKREARKAAVRAWEKLNAQSRMAAFVALPAHVERWRKEARSRNHIPHPGTWLNGERWEDELGEIFQQAPAPVKRPDTAWWFSHVLMERKGREVGVGPARPGEQTEQYRARIQAAIEDHARYGAPMP